MLWRGRNFAVQSVRIDHCAIRLDQRHGPDFVPPPYFLLVPTLKAGYLFLQEARTQIFVRDREASLVHTLSRLLRSLPN